MSRDTTKPASGSLHPSGPPIGEPRGRGEVEPDPGSRGPCPPHPRGSPRCSQDRLSITLPPSGAVGLRPRRGWGTACSKKVLVQLPLVLSSSVSDIFKPLQSGPSYAMDTGTTRKSGGGPANSADRTSATSHCRACRSPVESNVRSECRALRRREDEHRSHPPSVALRPCPTTRFQD